MSQQKEWARILASLRRKFCTKESAGILPELQRLYLEQMTARKNGDDGAEAGIVASIDEIGRPVAVPFDRQEMIEAGKVRPGANSTVEQMASGYLSTLQKWGYIKRYAQIPMNGPGRPSYTYVVTDYGFKVHLESMRAVVEKDGIEVDFEADFNRLSQAVQDLRQAHGKRAEAETYKELMKVHHEIVENHEKLNQ